MLKRIDSDEIIEEICSKAEMGIVIYGAGGYGRNVYQYLHREFDIKINCFAVSSKERVKSEKIEGIDVLTIEEAAKDYAQSILVVAASEQKQKEMIDLAEDQGFKNIYLILNEFHRYMQSELNTKRLEPLKKLNFEIHIADHCNLNCKGCYHFSPLSKECFLSVEEFEMDFEQMFKICGDKVSHITLLGGEPLLHPQIVDFICVVRKYFESCELEILTNGILLKDMNERFWNACVNHNVILSCTKYPVKVDYELLEKIADTYKLRIEYHNDVGAGEKMLIKYPFDLQGNQPIEWNYKHCTRSNKCITLKHGRLFTCPMAAHAHLAKEFFGLNIELSEKDSIDIYKVNHFEEITRFLVKPIPFCRYCNLKVKVKQLEWGVSKRRLEEWF